ncbi:MAG: DUF4301 family protein [Candidatus Dadabacteria bacterium]|nr:DUF4301 family protein [Candidatus Dadabacteria bacterium]
MIEAAAKLLRGADIEQITARGLSPEKVLAQIELIKKGTNHVTLYKPCTVRDGVKVIQKETLDRLCSVYDKAAAHGRAMKFVPASGVASRMFEPLYSLLQKLRNQDPDCVNKELLEDSDLGMLSGGIRKLPFFEELKAAMATTGLDLESEIQNSRWDVVIDSILNPRGLGYGNLPKGLVKFHLYPDGARSAFEEHLTEAALYTKDSKGTARIHFTVSPPHEQIIKEHTTPACGRLKEEGTEPLITFSTQHPSTDTITLDSDDIPLRDNSGRIQFRPGGHGALLQNLNDTEGDIVFIKNIDNTAPDGLKGTECRYKKALGGMLIEVQDKAFGFLEALTGKDIDEETLNEAAVFCSDELSSPLPREILSSPAKQRAQYLTTKLHRPLRVCGVVKHEGEPGGGPFWVRDSEGNLSLQIVESAEVDMSSPSQRRVWEQSTHFNPVDIVCGLKDFRGRLFDLNDYRDGTRHIISTKTTDGAQVKALELPGLWNGGMGNWNTLFVEVPLSTFNPVKTVFDLLRREHAAGK